MDLTKKTPIEMFAEALEKRKVKTETAIALSERIKPLITDDSRESENFFHRSTLRRIQNQFDEDCERIYQVYYEASNK